MMRAPNEERNLPAESFSTRYFCMRNPSFRYSGLVQMLDPTTKAGEEGLVFEDEDWSTRGELNTILLGWRRVSPEIIDLRTGTNTLTQLGSIKLGFLCLDMRWESNLYFKTHFFNDSLKN